MFISLDPSTASETEEILEELFGRSTPSAASSDTEDSIPADPYVDPPKRPSVVCSGKI